VKNNKKFILKTKKNDIHINNTTAAEPAWPLLLQHHYYYYYIHLTAFFSTTTCENQHQKGKTILDFNEVRDDG